MSRKNIQLVENSPPIEDGDLLDFFPFARANDAPPRRYAELRLDGLAKVRLWNGAIVWLATRYGDVRAILSDQRFSADVRRENYPFLAEAHCFQRLEPIPFVRMDPPAHGLLRRMFTAEFTHAKIQALRPLVERTFDTLLDGVIEAGGPLDIRDAAFLPLPSLIIAEMLGVPYADHTFFQACSTRKLALDGNRAGPLEAGEAIRAYLSDLLRAKEAAPERHDDMMGRLIVQHIRPGHLDRVDAIRSFEMLLMAGHETTANMITLGTLSLLQNPAMFAALRDDPTPKLTRQAVEEMLRFHSPAQFVGTRLCIEDAEIGGRLIRAGEGVLPMLNAANRDPAMFDDPDRFDIFARSMSPHVGFGFGVHQCLGQPLARLEMEVAFATLPRRMPGLRLAVAEEELEFLHDALVFGVKALPVAW